MPRPSALTIGSGVLLVGSLLAAAGLISARGTRREDELRPSPRREELKREMARLDQAARFGWTGALRGRIVAEDGRSLEGLPVEVSFTRHQTGAPGEGRTTCASDGTFEIRGLGDGDFNVWAGTRTGPYLPVVAKNVRHRGNQVQTLPDLPLRLGPRITVRVLDRIGDRPIADVPIYGDTTFDRDGRNEPAARTDASGVARIAWGDLDGWLTVGESNGGWRTPTGDRIARHFQFDSPRAVEWVVRIDLGTEPPVPASTAVTGVVVDEKGGGRTAAPIVNRRSGHRALTGPAQRRL